jgi:hypothetical protein
MTKFVFDISDFDAVESRVFEDVEICGRGWFAVEYHIDGETLEGNARITRESPFNMYVDPEAKEVDLSDAEYVIRARWYSKDKLKLIYPEHADEIDGCTQRYDTAESMNYVALEPLWYLRTSKKVRLIECYYKRYVKEKCFLLQSGDLIPVNKFDIAQAELVVKMVERNVCKIMVTAFIQDLKLESMESPYEHGEFPFVQVIGYYTGEAGDEPAGLVRDLKDLQREINKRRSQKMHILNTQANSGWIYEQGTLDTRQKETWRKSSSTPGAMLEYMPGRNAPGRIEAPAMPASIIQDEQANVSDNKDVSGINEAILGSDMPNSTSGRAIELRQKQAVTHLALLFDNFRIGKKAVLVRLWGKPHRKGIIQQFYTDEMTFRVVGEGGKTDFITVNQSQPVFDPVQGWVQQTMNDLSVGEFDIVVSDTPAAATARIAQFYAMLEALKLNVPIPVDMLVEASDWQNKDQIIQRINEEKQQQQQMMAAQAQATQQQKQPEKVSQSISFKDLPPLGQAQLAAKVGIQLDPNALAQQPNAQQQQPPQGGGNQADMIRQMVQQGAITPDMLQAAVQQGLIPPETAQALMAQMPQHGRSQEMEFQLGRALPQDRGVLSLEQLRASSY